MKNIVWKGLEHDSMEYCRIWRGDEGITVKSSVVGCRDGLPFVLEYRIELSPDWVTRVFQVRSNLGHIDHTLSFETDGQGAWYHKGKKLEHLQGCLDIDISATPMTNTLPLKRLKMGYGDQRDIEVLYMDIPSCHIHKEKQSYAFTGHNSYHFVNGDHSFSADILTDDDGIVQQYPGLFHCLLNGE